MATIDRALGVVKVEELLKEVRFDYDGVARGVESVVNAVRKTLMSLDDIEISCSLAAATLEDLGVPKEKAGFRFVKPESVVVVGSYAAQTLTKPNLSVDLAVRIPKVCFNEKDYLNHRYFAKRILYLAHIERELLKCRSIATVEWVGFNHDARKPILILHLAQQRTDGLTTFTLRIIPTVPVDLFNITKLSLGRNNLRTAMANGLPQPTPHYNSGIIEDMVMEDIASWVQQEQSKHLNIRDAISLAKVWLRQRSMQGHGDGMTGFLASVLITHLLTSAGKSSITEHMSSIQAFRVFLDAIGNADILGKGIFLQQSQRKSLTIGADHPMRVAFDVLVCDPAGNLNIAHRMSKSALTELKKDSLITLESMKGVNDMGFEPTFMTPVDFVAKFDYQVRIDVPSDTSATFCDSDSGSWRAFENRVATLLTRSLSDRVLLVRVIQRNLPSGWKPTSGLKSVRDAPVYAGIVLNSIDISLKMADIGPRADDKEEAKMFRSFWGEKSELRHFKDGKICETAVWEIEPWKRHHIIEQIINHTLSRHLALSLTSIKVTAGQIDFAINVREKDQILNMPKILDAFEALSEKLRKLQNLPLKVVSVQPLSAVFRYSSVYYPNPHPWADERVVPTPSKGHGACLDPLEVALVLEGSGKWPEDLIAIQKTKTAFCLKIAQSLGQLWGISCQASEHAVDILMHGFAFRLLVLYEKDQTHLNRERIAASMVRGRILPGVPNIRTGDFSLKSDLLLRSIHASTLHGLHGMYPAYSPTVRLAKRWLASHLLSGSLAEEAVELIVAHLFVRAAPYSPPSSRITGFLRFLWLLSSHDWSLSPLIVDVNGDITARHEEFIQNQFDSARLGSDGSECQPMFIATAYDLSSETWTRSSPSLKEMKRLVSYAKSAVPVVHAMVRGEGDAVGWQTLFRTNLDSFDVVVLLHHVSLPHPSRVLFPATVYGEPVRTADPPNHALSAIPESATKGSLETGRRHLLIGFDPVFRFVEELKQRLGKSCNIWYDTIGNDVVGLTMARLVGAHSSTQVPKRKKVTEQYCTPASVVNAIEIVGEGLIRSIYLPEKLAKPKA